MSFIHPDTLELTSKRKVKVTSFISQPFINSEKGDRVIIPLPYQGDQDRPGFVKNLKTELEQANQDYVIYETEDCHGKSNNKEDYLGTDDIPALTFSEWDEALTKVIDYQPDSFFEQKGLPGRKYQMNNVAALSLAGWLAMKQAQTSGPNAKSKLDSLMVLNMAPNFFRKKMAESINAELWSENGPRYIESLMRGQLFISPDGEKVSYTFAKSTQNYEINLEAPFYTDVQIKIFLGMKDDIIDYRETMKFSEKIVSPIKPQIFLLPEGKHNFSQDFEFNFFWTQMKALKLDPEYGLYHKVGLSWKEWEIQEDKDALSRRMSFKHYCGSATMYSVQEAIKHANESH